MRTLMLTLLTLLILPLHAANENSATWLEDWDKAKAQAAEQNKPILIDFTGSDWCGWCIKLKNEVFTTDAFAQWATNNVILMEADFPQGKQLPPAVQQQNQQLAQQYGIRGFPTIVFVDAEGNEIGRTGYLEGGPDVWLDEAKQILP